MSSLGSEQKYPHLPLASQKLFSFSFLPQCSQERRSQKQCPHQLQHCTVSHKSPAGPHENFPMPRKKGAHAAGAQLWAAAMIPGQEEVPCYNLIPI